MTEFEEEYVHKAFVSNWIAPLGPQVDAFESEMADIVHVPNTVALSSGTAALHLALVLLGVNRGDEVVCSTLTFSASANPIVYQGADPIFIDCDATWTMDPNLLEDALKLRAASGKRPKAAVVVDLYGQCADYESICRICDQFGVPVIEDAAEALGSTYWGRSAGEFGRLAAFSFNGNKIVTTSGGGMLVSTDKTLTDRARFLATQARDPAPHYEHSTIGYNYRLSNVLAAIGRGQLKTLEQRVAAKRRVFERYRSTLGLLPGITMMPESVGCASNRWLTCMTIEARKFGATREDIRLALEGEDIESRPIWKPMHLQPVFAGAATYGGAASEALFESGLCLPSGSNLQEDEQARVIDVIRRNCPAA